MCGAIVHLALSQCFHHWSGWWEHTKNAAKTWECKRILTNWWSGMNKHSIRRGGRLYRWAQTQAEDSMGDQTSIQVFPESTSWARINNITWIFEKWNHFWDMGGNPSDPVIIGKASPWALQSVWHFQKALDTGREHRGVHERTTIQVHEETLMECREGEMGGRCKSSLNKGRSPEDKLFLMSLFSRMRSKLQEGMYHMNANYY